MSMPFAADSYYAMMLDMSLRAFDARLFRFDAAAVDVVDALWCKTR